MSSKLSAARGFVLPTTLLVTTLLTVMLTAAFILVSAEYRTTDNSLAAARALAVGQAGLQTYFTLNRRLGPNATYDSARIAVPGGYADVIAQRLRAASAQSQAMWVVRSSGYSTDPLQPGSAQAKRTVAQLAYFNPGQVPARAALVAINGVQMVGNGGNPISGINTGFYVQGCTTPANDDTTGLSTTKYGGSGSANPTGTIPIEYLDTLGLIDSTRIDWAKVLAGEFSPDYVGTLPASGNNTYMSHFFEGDLTLPSGTRRGMLVVTGDLTLSSGTHWDGIIVVGGRLDANPLGSSPNFVLHGMVITGLGLSQGENPGDNVVRRTGGGGTRVIRWDWCYVQAAAAAFSALVPYRNIWIDTWSTY